jgi:hypothetical protein
MLIDMIKVKHLTITGAILGTSTLITPLFGLGPPLHFVIYGAIYTLFTALYLWKIQRVHHPVPGLEKLFGRLPALAILYGLFVILFYYWIRAIFRWSA